MSHIIFAAWPIWGHSRPLLSLALNIASAHPQLSISFLSSTGFVPLIEKEIKRFHATTTLSSQIKIIPVGSTIDKANLGDFGAQLVDFLGNLPTILKPLFSLPPDGVDHSRRPNFAAADAFLTTFIDVLHGTLEELSLEQNTVPLYMFFPVTAASLIEHFGDGGHYSGLESKAKRLVAEGVIDSTGQDPLEVLAASYLHFEDRITHYPGTAALYEHEFQPQLDCVPLPPPVLGMLVTSAARATKWDGVIISSTYELEPGAREALEESWRIPILQIGPQFPDRWWSHIQEAETSVVDRADRKVVLFLDSCQARFGSHSVLYISFGTLFFPTARSDLLRALVNSLLAASPPVPFLFALSGCLPKLQAELEEVLKDHRDLAHLTKFAPQIDVLKHSATGWFLTHGGSNSMFEAILWNVPLVLWPLAADQPLNAAHLSQVLKVAFELVQVRNGPSVGKPTMRGITPSGKLEDLDAELKNMWVKIRGAEGKEVRKRMEEISKVVKESWATGESRKAFEALEKLV